jgi:hypothetical protein
LTATNDGFTEYRLTFDNPAGTIPRGHRLALLVSVSDPSGPFHRLSFAGGERRRSFVTLDEEADPRALRTLLSTSPPGPDGDGGWFISPVTVTLTAEDPDFAGALTLYSWGIDPPSTIYAGSFLAPLGRETLYYYSLDPFNNRDAVQRQPFRVDTVIVPPEMRTPLAGEEVEPLTVSGSTEVSAEAFDATSGVSLVAFYAFAQQGDAWDPVGRQIGSNQYPLVGTTYRTSWDTFLMPDGLYKVQAQLRDIAGNLAFSSPQYVRVMNFGVDGGSAG